MDRLRVITRRNLPAGAQAAQLVHAALGFAAEHPEVTAGWMDSSNTVVLLAAEDEQALLWLLMQASMRGVRYSAFRDPDLGETLTAIALEPGVAARRLCRGLPVALRPTPAEVA